MNPFGAALAAVVLLLPPAGLPAVAGRTHCVVSDVRVDEASGLVAGVGASGDLMVVANDSGDSGRVFVLDDRCRTVGVRTYGGEGAATDVEALAPDDAAHVWVGDLGDNLSDRTDVVVRRVAVGRGDRDVRAASYRLVYPDGPHDAETLLRDPRSGRLFVVTKQLLTSQVYAAPARLDPDAPNRLTRVAQVSLTPTDGALLPDGRTVVLRGYDSALVYDAATWRLRGSVRLPEQPQGESLAATGPDRVRVGSEGTDQPVLDVRLPDDLTSADHAPTGDDADASGREDGSVLRISILLACLVAVLGGGAALLRRRVR